jgi:UDP-N-acetylmuramate--alanine ligase
VAIVTNIDAEHLDHWGDFDAVKKGFQDFIENIPFYGFAAVCTDHPEVQALTSRIENRRLVTYGVQPAGRGPRLQHRDGPRGLKFDIVVSPRDGEEVRYEGLKMPMAGHHNVLNATAAVAVARELSVDADAIRGPGQLRRGQAPLHHHGRRQRHPHRRRLWPPPGRDRRRAEGRPRGHSTGKVIAVVQPHRFTRLRDLMTEFSSCFNDADTVIVADVYTAGEQPIEGVDKDHLVEGLKKFGHRRRPAAGEPRGPASPDRRGGQER